MVVAHAGAAAETMPVLAEAMRPWRLAQPAATFAAIEAAATRQVAALRATLIATALATAAPGPVPLCEVCGRVLHRAGTRTRTLTTHGQERPAVTGPRYRCPACGAELFPPG